MKRSIKTWLERLQGRAQAPTPAAAAAGGSSTPASPAHPEPAEELCALPQPLPWPPPARVLVLAPHPDDEAIGCGGLILRLLQAGSAVRVVLVTDGGGAGDLPPAAAAQRQQEFRASLARLGVQEHRMLGFPDGGLVAAAPLFEAVRAEVQAFAPQWVVGPSAADAHRDHRCVAQALRLAALAEPAVQLSLEYETWGALPATHVLDISDVLQVKLAALGEHATALAQLDYVRAIQGLAYYRGLLLREKRPQPAGEAFLCSTRDSGFAWPAGWGRPPGA